MGEQQPACLFSTTVNVESYTQQREEQCVAPPSPASRAACRLRRPCLRIPKRLNRLSTGNYILIDVRCRACQTPLGWRYLKACSHVRPPP